MPFFITLLICLIIVFAPVVLASKSTPQVMLASTKMLASLPNNTSGFYISEKYDGVRAYWTGSHFLTRQGNTINAPSWFTKDFPSEALDGELWISRNNFDSVSAAIRRHKPNHNEWRMIKFMVFDIPIHNLAFYQRKERLLELFNRNKPLPNVERTLEDDTTSPTPAFPTWLQLVSHLVFDTKVELEGYFNSVIKDAGEGIMVNVGNATYEAGRSKNIFKVKPLYDAEAVVTAYQPGKGKYKGLLGALWVRNNKGQIFKIGSGFTDEERRSPPKVGAVITYEYSGFSKTGLPRFARFSKIRTDL
ncbi:DNA ligase [Psychrosphaera haliotis]|nr:DNA ligase [Psychrosphaera haliotis]